MTPLLECIQSHTEVQTVIAGIKSTWKFLHWKKDRQPEDFTESDLEVIQYKDIGTYSALKPKSCCYSKTLMKSYTEHLWQKFVNMDAQLNGESHSPSVSCNPIIIPRGVSRATEVIVLSLFYPNNLLNSFLYSVGRQSTPACPCGEGDQTSYHIVTKCGSTARLVSDCIQELLNCKFPDHITLLNHSRDSRFFELLLDVIKTSKINFRTEIIL